MEIVPGRATDPRHLAAVQALLGGWRWRRCCWSAPRRGLSVTGCSLRCCVRRCIVHTGIASAEVVDQVMRASLGRRYAMVGPLEAADMTGLPTVADIARHLFPELATGDEMMALVEQRPRGDTGQRSGGDYLWDARRGTTNGDGRISCALR